MRRFVSASFPFAKVGKIRGVCNAVFLSIAFAAAREAVPVFFEWVPSGRMGQ
jgi:hypothetical protein